LDVSALKEDLAQIEEDWRAVYRLIGAMGEKKFLIAVLERQERAFTLANKIDVKRKEIEAATAGSGVKAVWSYRQHASAPDRGSK
jgi:hypothetical protein